MSFAQFAVGFICGQAATVIIDNRNWKLGAILAGMALLVYFWLA